MQIVFHLGAHCTDNGRLIRSILRSRAQLPEEVLVPGPRGYRTILREAVTGLGGRPAPDEMQRDLLDLIVDSDRVERVVLFHENLLALPTRVVSDDGLYAMMPRRLAAVRNLFPSHDVSFTFGLVDPAVLIPSLVARAGAEDYESMLGGADPAALGWLGTIRRTVYENEGIDLTVWANEDSALIWPEILRALTGAPADVPLDGDLDMAGALLTDEGLARLKTEYAKEPAVTRDQRYALLATALEADGKPGEFEIEAALPGWTQALVDHLGARYLDDCARIAGMPGLRYLGP